MVNPCKYLNLFVILSHTFNYFLIEKDRCIGNAIVSKDHQERLKEEEQIIQFLVSSVFQAIKFLLPQQSECVLNMSGYYEAQG